MDPSASGRRHVVRGIGGAAALISVGAVAPLRPALNPFSSAPICHGLFVKHGLAVETFSLGDPLGWMARRRDDPELVRLHRDVSGELGLSS